MGIRENLQQTTTKKKGRKKCLLTCSQSNNVVIQFSLSLTLLESIASSTILLSNDLTAYQFTDLK